ncbi:MAG: metallophosphoesterase [Chthonomonadales bacterium]|nr:metallophosphoesterase [Chthonomonadales bacterium]
MSLPKESSAAAAQESSPEDGIDRRGFLKCMAWAGTGLIWTVTGGVPESKAFGQQTGKPRGDFTFVQISDSHIGFSKPANPDVTGTLKEAIARINTLEQTPDLLLHTGDLSHLAKPAEFDTLEQSLKAAKVDGKFYVPGEHDMLDDGKQYLLRYGKGTQGQGWHSFTHKGVHFIGLVNVLEFDSAKLGQIGGEQLAWLEKDVKRLPSSTPIVVFAHVPLWSVYPEWGWGTADSAQALGYLKRFGSVTVLNGHIHQTMQKVEGTVTFHTARSTAFPQPAPGKAPSPGPMLVPADTLRSVLGITRVQYVRNGRSLAITDTSLS